VIDGLGIHFLHVRSPHAEALPLIITHGWPGSIIEFLKVIGPLTDPTAHGGEEADAFHVVCPSLPGYGFSDKPAQPGWGVERIAAAWTVLMGRLGYKRYGAEGSDWGTSVSASIGQQDPDHVTGIHLTPPLAPPDPAMFDDLTERERAALASLEHSAQWDSGYSQEHATRPQRWANQGKRQSKFSEVETEGSLTGSLAGAIDFLNPLYHCRDRDTLRNILCLLVSQSFIRGSATENSRFFCIPAPYWPASSSRCSPDPARARR